jgi:hypothetical protein
MICAALLAASTTMFAASFSRRSPADYDVFRGTTVIKVFGDAIVIGVFDDRSKSEGNIDLFRLETDGALNPLSVVLRNATVQYRGGELVVMDATTQTFYTFSTPQAQFTAPRMPAGFTGANFVGYGLNHTIRPLDGLTSSSKSGGRKVVTLDELPCEICMFEQDPYDTGGGGGGGGTTTTCTSGGTGSVACSITTNQGACSVTCASGYYACCKDRFLQLPHCSCVHN